MKGNTVSFAGVGVTSIYTGRFPIISATKGYVIDPEGERAIAWNPQTMQLTGKQVSLTGAHRDGLILDSAAYPTSVRIVGNEVFLPVLWGDADYVAQTISGVVVLDYTTDTVSTVLADTRCGDSGIAVDSPAGDTYYFPTWGTTRFTHLDAPPPRPTMCSLRVLKGQKTFDLTYVLDLTTLVGGTTTAGGAAQGAISDGKNGFYFGVTDEALYASKDTTGYFFNKLWHYDFVTNTAQAVANAPMWGASAMGRQVSFDGKVYAVTSAYDANLVYKTVVFQLEGTKVATFEMPGFVDFIGKLR